MTKERNRQKITLDLKRPRADDEEEWTQKVVAPDTRQADIVALLKKYHELSESYLDDHYVSAEQYDNLKRLGAVITEELNKPEDEEKWQK